MYVVWQVFDSFFLREKFLYFCADAGDIRDLSTSNLSLGIIQAYLVNSKILLFSVVTVPFLVIFLLFETIILSFNLVKHSAVSSRLIVVACKYDVCNFFRLRVGAPDVTRRPPSM